MMGRRLLRAHRISDTRSDGMHLKIRDVRKIEGVEGIEDECLGSFDLLQNLLKS